MAYEDGVFVLHTTKANGKSRGKYILFKSKAAAEEFVTNLQDQLKEPTKI